MANLLEVIRAVVRQWNDVSFLIWKTTTFWKLEYIPSTLLQFCNEISGWYSAWNISVLAVLHPSFKVADETYQKNVTIEMVCKKYSAATIIAHWKSQTIFMSQKLKINNLERKYLLKIMKYDNIY